MALTNLTCAAWGPGSHISPWGHQPLPQWCQNGTGLLLPTAPSICGPCWAGLTCGPMSCPSLDLSLGRVPNARGPPVPPHKQLLARTVGWPWLVRPFPAVLREPWPVLALAQRNTTSYPAQSQVGGLSHPHWLMGRIWGLMAEDCHDWALAVRGYSSINNERSGMEMMTITHCSSVCSVGRKALLTEYTEQRHY